MKIFLSPLEIKALYFLAAKRSLRDECILRVMGNTGLRVSDARTILVSDVASDNGEIYSSLRKKMKKTGKYIERSLNEATRDALKRYLPIVQGKSVYLFPGSNQKQPISRGYCHKLFKILLKQLMPQETDLRAASTHTLRRSVGFMISENCNIETAAEFLGHSNIGSTTSYLSKEVLKRKSDEFLRKDMNF